MRVVVVGATGNTGTALLRALAGEPDMSLAGIARRFPDRTAPPYRGVEWTSLDVGSTEPDAVVVDRLTEAFRGADTVVHLAWLVQPNRDRDLLRRTNVDGTRRVASAAARAGVRHLVVASSVGAYSGVSDDVPRAEDWPTHGIPTSHYSVDKAAQERVLDAAEREHPELTVTRVRPALVFQGDAAAQIARYFLGPLVPIRLLRFGRPPLLPLPAGLRVQALHAADLADAYRRIVVARAAGAFNVAADDILPAGELARVVDHGRLVELPPPVVRAAVAYAYQARAIAPDPGWLDLAMSVPVLDSTRIRTELGLRPAYTAAQAIEELLGGLAAGHGHRSAPMRPSGTSAGSTSHSSPGSGSAVSSDSSRGSGSDSGSGSDEAASPSDTPTMQVPSSMDRTLLGLYLADHLTGATAGLGRIERMARTYDDVPFQAELAELAAQIRAERDLYVDLQRAFGLPRRPLRQAASWTAERVGRLKLNGRVVRRSPLTPVVETELMRSAVVGKMGGWQTLREHASALGLDPGQIDTLLQTAQRQLETLDRLHAAVRAGAFQAE